MPSMFKPSVLRRPMPGRVRHANAVDAIVASVSFTVFYMPAALRFNRAIWYISSLLRCSFILRRPADDVLQGRTCSGLALEKISRGDWAVGVYSDYVQPALVISRSFCMFRFLLSTRNYYGSWLALPELSILMYDNNEAG